MSSCDPTRPSVAVPAANHAKQRRPNVARQQGEPRETNTCQLIIRAPDAGRGTRPKSSAHLAQSPRSKRRDERRIECRHGSNWIALLESSLVYAQNCPTAVNRVPWPMLAARCPLEMNDVAPRAGRHLAKTQPPAHAVRPAPRVRSTAGRAPSPKAGLRGTPWPCRGACDLD